MGAEEDVRELADEVREFLDESVHQIETAERYLSEDIKQAKDTIQEEKDVLEKGEDEESMLQEIKALLDRIEEATEELANKIDQDDSDIENSKYEFEADIYNKVQTIGSKLHNLGAEIDYEEKEVKEEEKNLHNLVKELVKGYKIINNQKQLFEANKEYIKSLNKIASNMGGNESLKEKILIDTEEEKKVGNQLETLEEEEETLREILMEAYQLLNDQIEMDEEEIESIKIEEKEEDSIISNLEKLKKRKNFQAQDQKRVGATIESLKEIRYELEKILSRKERIEEGEEETEIQVQRVVEEFS
jgi:DNA repair exonuclease SbcCD ATPase subunit